MITTELGIFTDLNSSDKEGKIKVDIVHKPQISNLWISLTLDESLSEHFEENNLAPPTLISFKDYASYCKYVGSDEFQSLFVINSFIE